MTAETDIQLRDKNVEPSDAVLSGVLREAYSTYLDLLAMFQANGLTVEWRYYDDGKAWLCKVQKKDRTIVWMSAGIGFLNATLYIPSKHMPAITQLGINPASLQAILNTNPVGKSQPCTFEIRSSQVLDDFEKIMRFKLANK